MGGTPVVILQQYQNQQGYPPPPQTSKTTTTHTSHKSMSANPRGASLGGTSNIGGSSSSFIVQNSS